MKQIKPLFAAVALLLASHIAQAQAALCFTPGQVAVDNDTVWYVTNGDTDIHYQMNILNCGNDSFIGSIDVYIIRNAAAPTILGTISNAILGIGDSVEFQITDIVVKTNTDYKGGDNVIVIWPAVPSPPPFTSDTATLDIYVEGNISSSSQPQKIPDKGFVIGPNPAGNKLLIGYQNRTASVDLVRITDPAGRILFETFRETDQVDLSGFTPGIYFLEVRYAGQASEVCRIIRE